jgi:hypothetical protein
MAWATATATFGPFEHCERPGSLLVDAGTGTVVLEASDDAATWITAATYSADAMKTIDLANVQRLRLSVTGDAKYSFTFG